jgi:hypothetical protein
MRPRHATALALVGWYLMAPPAFPGRADMPLSENMRADQQFDERAPLSRWSALGALPKPPPSATLPADASGMIRNRR